MSTYAIGDIQGCFEALNLLLEKIQFDPAHDRVWLVGDLINRGPDSLSVLRWAMGLGERAVTVLGNHDLHFLAVAAGHVPAQPSDTLDSLLGAPDRDQLIDWLRRQHLIYAEGDWLMVHAGLLPQWSAAQALSLGQEVEAVLRGEAYHDFLRQMYGNQPDHWSANLAGMDRLRIITNAMTRLRVCTPGGVMDFKFKGPPEARPAGTLPWYEVPGRNSADANIIFGHWSALGLHVDLSAGRRYVALDTGCLWGGQLSALRLEDRQVFQTSCAGLASSKQLR